MPVKIRCRGCEKVLNAPDKARGRVIKCPNCETKLKVPAGESAAKAPQKQATQKKKRPVKTPTPKSPSDSGFLDNLDFDAIDEMEHDSARVCPNCATKLSGDDPVCPKCGTDADTGRLAETVRRKRARSGKGPDPHDYYGNVWSDCWAFTKKHAYIAVRSGIIGTVMVVLQLACQYMWVVYCTRTPPRVFWWFLSTIFALGLAGWYWNLMLRVVEMGRTKEKKLGRIFFNFFENVTLGLRANFWPIIVLGPALPLMAVILIVAIGVDVAAISAGGLPIVALIVLLLFYITPWLLFPIAASHMTTNYTYKAWILWELVKLIPKNIAPVMFWVLIAFVSMLPVIGLLVGLELLGGADPWHNARFVNAADRGAAWLYEALIDLPNPEAFLYQLIKGTFMLLLAILVMIPVMFTLGFSTLFLLRATGLFAFYNTNNLEYVNTMAPNTPATFWVRFLAFSVDLLLLPLTPLIVFAEKRSVIVGWLLIGVTGLLFLTGANWIIMLPIMLPYFFWMYFATQEGSDVKSTIGKDGFGLIVLKDNDRQVPLKLATMRVLVALIQPFILFAGFIMVAFHKEKKAFQDLATETKVVWKGDR